MNRQTFNVQITGLCDYYRRELSDLAINVYWNGLKGMTDKDFINAVAQEVATNEFFPKVPDILKHVTTQPRLENKSKLSWCNNTSQLLAQYSEGAA
ncbi:hypothetical protein ACOI22_03475 [Glaciecola sp. 2405UD65-10]|uniref:hypothetical protein n=1 Tax=Glaciecola sp. 2405UD65-10 TaxID=3397244 RepID=UPI003B5B6357